MGSLRYRVAAIVAVTALSLWALFPRTVVERARGPNGEFIYNPDGTERLDTTRRIPIKRGLDLQGGTHLTLEVDESKGTIPNKADAIDRALKVVRTRIDQFGVAEPVVQKAGNDRIVVELPGIDDQKRAVSVVQQSAFLQFQIVDKTQALDKALPHIDAVLKSKGLAATTPRGGAAPAPTAGVQSLFSTPSDTVRPDTGKAAPPTAPAPAAPGHKATQRAHSKASAAPQTGDTARSHAVPATKSESGAKDTGALSGITAGQFSRLVQQGQTPGEYFVAQADVPTVQRYLALPEVQAALPPGKVVRWANDTLSIGQRAYRAMYVLDARPIITGEYLIDAQPASDPIEGTKVDFQLNREGGRRFQAETARHIKDYMAIVLDTLVMGRPPVIQSAIGSRGQITMGGRDLQAAQDLALVLRAGALPVPLKVAEVRAIGASLGADSVRKGVTAGLIAIVLVIVIMAGYYRGSGILAVGGLTLYVLYTLAGLATAGAVLTLPGLAGFVLSIGIAVDANVLIFERIREELDGGKTPRTAINDGFRHAMTAIIDSNVTTVLTAAVLYQYGSGPVKGFAVTLIAGILASMVTSIFVVRTFYMVWLGRAQAPQTISI
jgi:preprotein translocase subunit SecD